MVLGGGYQEAGFDGRRNLRAGDVVVHSPYDAHLNYVEGGGAELINLPYVAGDLLPPAFRIDDVDAIVRVAERDPVAAALALKPAAETLGMDDWPDLLARELVASPDLRLADWALRMRLAPETLSRGFRLAYGLTPAAFRAEARARMAMEQLMRGDASLAAVAAECGYADQPHFSRAILSLTGRSPGYWRKRSIPFKKAASAQG